MIKYVDIVVGLSCGDEGKGKVVSQLSRYNDYDLVCRWSGGNNAGHTVYVNGKSYKTHLIPSGVFYDTVSIIGPGCVLHPESFYQELEYLKDNGFDSNLVKVSPNCHIVQDEHIAQDRTNLAKKLGTTGKGISYAYAAKAAKTGIQAKDVLDKKYLWDEVLYGTILCEGAQGVWLDIDQGNYPYVTSGQTLPHTACSLGFSIHKINKIYGCAKIYDTRSGEDPLFPESLFDDPVLLKIANIGQEYGVTTGRRRKVNYLNLDNLIKAINITGTTHLLINKCDILEQVNCYDLYYKNVLQKLNSMDEMRKFIEYFVMDNCEDIKEILFSFSPEII